MAEKTGSAVPPPPSLAYYDFYKTNTVKVVTYTVGPSLTRQEFKDECDINKIMERYDGHVIGGPGNLAPQNPVYLDWTEMPTDLMDYMNKMKEAETAFMTLPAKVRREFDDSAIAFVDFASDPNNLGQMQEWGLAPPAASPAVAPEKTAGASPAKAPSQGSEKGKTSPEAS